MAWESRKVRVIGRVVDQPRLIAYMANDPDIKYTYSGLTLDPKPWSSAVAEIKVDWLSTPAPSATSGRVAALQSRHSYMHR